MHRHTSETTGRAKDGRGTGPTGNRRSGHDETSLRRIRRLSTATADDLAALARLASRRQLAAGDTLFRQHAPCRDVFALLDGALKLCRDGGAGQEMVLELVAPGALLGEHALAASSHPYSAVALCDCRLLTFSAMHLDNVLERHPGIGRALMAQLHDRNLTMMDRVLQQARFSAVQRVASLLLEHSASDGTLNPELASCSRRDLSTLLTLRPETLSRVFSRLRRDGALREPPDGALIVNRPALAALSPGANDTLQVAAPG